MKRSKSVCSCVKQLDEKVIHTWDALAIR